MAQSTSAPAARRRRTWRYVLIGAAGVLVLLVAALVAARLYFSDEYIKQQIQAVLKDSLGRDCEIQRLSFSLLSGRAQIENFKLLNADASFAEPAGAKLARADVELDLWSLAFSGLTKLKSVKLNLDGLELTIERRRVEGRYVTNWDDVIARLFAGPPGVWPKATGLRALDFQVSLRGGVVRLKDPELGETRLTPVELAASQPALGQPTELEFSLTQAAQAGAAGTARIEGRCVWISEQGLVGPETIKDGQLTANLNGLDLGVLARHLGLETRVQGGRREMTPGRAFTGTLKLEAKDLKSLRCDGSLAADGLVSLWEGAHRVAGNVPGRLVFSGGGGWEKGAWSWGPVKGSLTAAGALAELAQPDARGFLDLRLDAAEGLKRGHPLQLDFAARLEDLFATDVGRILGLHGQLKGRLRGQTTARVEADNSWKAEGKLATEEFFVTVKGVPQPAAVDVSFDARVVPDAAGRPESGEVSLQARARPFQLASQGPIRLSGLNDPGKLAVTGTVKAQVRGRELWEEFGPLLSVFGLGAPLAEALDGELRLEGAAGKASLRLDCSLARQAGEPEPLRLQAQANCDFAAWEQARGEPSFNFDVQLQSAAAKPLDARLKGTLSRGAAQQVWELKEFRGAGALEALSRLNARFGAYVRVFLGPEYVVSGQFEQTAQSKLVRQFSPEGHPTSDRLTLVTDLKLLSVDLRGPALVEAKPPLQWQEDNCELHLELEQQQGLDSQTLAIPSVVFKTPGTALEGRLGEARLDKLAAAAKAQKAQVRAWLEALPDTRLNASVSAGVIERLQQLGVLRAEPLVAGDLRLRAEYGARDRRLRQVQLVFKRPDLSVQFDAPEMDLSPLAERLEAAERKYADWPPAFPSCALSLSAQAAAVARLQALGLIPADAPLRGDFQLTASYDRARQQLAVENFIFSNAGGSVSFSAPAVPLGPFCAELDKPKFDLESAARALAGFKLDLKAGEPWFEVMRARKWLPEDLAVSGKLELKAGYDGQADRLSVDQLDFARSAASNSPLLRLTLGADKAAGLQVAGVRALLARLADPTDLLKDWPALLKHLDRGLTVGQATVSPAGVAGLLAARGVDGALAESIRAGALRLAENWSVEQLRLAPADKPGEYDVSANFHTTAAWHPRSAAGVPEREPAARIGGAWRIGPLRVNPQPLAIQGTLFLDDAELLCNVGAPYFVYSKAVGVPCRLAFQGALKPGGGLSLAGAQLQGGPLGFVLSNLDYAPSGAVQLAQLALSDGPLPGTLSGLLYDPAADKLRFAFDAGDVDVARLVSFGTLPPALKFSGTLGQTRVSYDGRASVFPKSVTTKDQLSFRSALKDVRVAGRAPGEPVDLVLNGALIATPFGLGSERLLVRLDYAPQGQPALSEELEIVPEVTAKAPDTALLAAFSQPGMPIRVRAPLRSQSPVDVLGTVKAIGALSAAAGPASARPAGDLSAINQLRLEMSLTAPAVTVASLTLRNVQAQTIVLDQLQLSIPSLTAEGYGGRVEASEMAYNLGTDPIGHSQKLVLTDLDLHGLTTDPARKPDKDRYQVQGRLSATGVLSGAGFAPAQRRSWQGQLQGTVRDLVAQRGEGKPRGPDAKKIGFGILGTLVGGGLGRGMQLFSGDFGLFLDRMEFEPCQVSAAIQQGRAQVAQGALTGRGQNAGLQMGFVGTVDLATETFDPKFLLWPAMLPPRTQQLMGLEKLGEQDRQAILQDFANAKYAIVLTGPIAEPHTNQSELALAFTRLLSQIESKSQASKPETQTPAAPKPESPLPLPFP